MTTLKEAIEALGKTPEEVMAKLREKGIKGNRMRANSCPIAKYLKACGFPHITVDTHVNMYDDECLLSTGESLRLPKEVRSWVIAFDEGFYPEFDANPFTTVGEYGT